MKVNKKNKTLKSYVCISAFCSLSVTAAPTTLGYFQPGPNEFWPFSSPAWAGTGTVIQQESPFTNPDIFCKMQGGGFRTFSLGELNGYYRYYGVFRNSATYKPGHWANYYNNDINLPKLKSMGAIDTRQTGALFNEWGDLNGWGNGWDKPGYWTAEPDTTANRQAMSGKGTGVNAAVSTATYGTVCVTDMIPIPFLDQSHVDES